MTKLDLVPVPMQILRRPGTFRLDASVHIACPGPLIPVACYLRDVLNPGTGLRLSIGTEQSAADGSIILRLEPDSNCNDEAYTLDVTTDVVEISGRTLTGLHWGIQAIRQLLSADCLRAARTVTGPIEIPCVRIVDEPRFPWRGLMLDVARHFMPKIFVLRMIDIAAIHRLNVLHLHLTDDQGWRMEVPTWPLLTVAGAWRRGTAHGPVDSPGELDGVPHGGFYTLADLAEIVSYGAERHVTVVPEVGFPGHVQAALCAYPELGNTGPHEVRTRWGHSQHVLSPTPLSFRFIDEILDVVLDTFSSKYIHIGGDECSRAEWRASDVARKAAAGFGLQSVDGLQSLFLRRGVAKIVANGRRAVGWDQVMDDGGVPADTVVMVWRDFAKENVVEAALSEGHDVIQCPTRTTYLDHAQSSRSAEPFAFYGQTTLEDIINYDPAADVPRIFEGKILGTQAHLWTEYMTTPAEVEYMAFPRLGAVADAAWSSPAQRAAEPLLGRMPGYLARLDALGVNYRPLGGPLPWQARPGSSAPS